VHPQPLPHGALDAIPAQPRADARTRVSAGRYRAVRARPPRPVGHRHAGRPAPAPVVLLGTPHVVAGGVLATAAVVALDLTLTHRLSLFFDLCFILVSLCAALLVRRRGLYTVGILPPLLLGAVVAIVAVLSPAALTDSRLPLVSTWLTGLAHHGVALAAAHVVVLAIVGLRATTQPAGTDRPRPAREGR
jgi:hypothetical protein